MAFVSTKPRETRKGQNTNVVHGLRFNQTARDKKGAKYTRACVFSALVPLSPKLETTSRLVSTA